MVSAWEKPMIGEIEKAIMKSDLGLNPSNNGDTIRCADAAADGRETRREYTKQAKNEGRKCARGDS